MTTHAFQVAPGLVAPTSAIDIPLVNIRPSSEPPEPLKSIIDSLTGDYDAFETRYWCKTYLDLFDAGILTTSDLICVHGRTQHDALINLTGGLTPTLINGTFSTSLGIVLDGTDDYIATGLIPANGGLNWTMNSASAAMLVTDGDNVGAQAYVMGQASAGTLTAILRPKNNSVSTTSGASMNSATAISASYSGPWDGVWMVNRTDSDSVRLLRDAALIASSDSNTATALPTGQITFGRQSTATYGAVKVGGIALGAGRTTTQESDLQSILNAHFARMAE